MMYEYMKLNDGTALAYSNMHDDGTVKIYIEKPVYQGFAHATCILPQYDWSDIEGFSSEEIDKIKRLIMSNSHLILDFAQNGGLDNAAGF